MDIYWHISICIRACLIEIENPPIRVDFEIARLNTKKTPAYEFV